jgi:hypothetical protein
MWIPEEFKATRKPMLQLRLDGLDLPRNADRHIAAPKQKLPPRATRSEPFRGPQGSLEACSDMMGIVAFHVR